MKRTTLILMIGLLVSVLTVLSVSAAEQTQQYVSEDGTLNFSYPESYALGGDMETGIDLTADWGIALIYKVSYDTLNIPEGSRDPATLLATLEASAPERQFTDQTDLVVNAYDAVRAKVTDVDGPSLIIILEIDPLEAVIVYASPSVSQYDAMETDVTAIVETINQGGDLALKNTTNVKPPVDTVALVPVAADCSARFPIDGFAC
ncbi:MAG: hypothetical protein ABI690_29775 [Chloroflexota bacterium]